MKLKFSLISLLFVICVSVGCARTVTPVMPPRGVIFTYYKAPLEIDFKKANMDNDESGGETIFFFEPCCLFSSWGFGRADIQKAAEERGITEIDYVDYEYISYLFGIYQNLRIIPHGK